MLHFIPNPASKALQEQLFPLVSGLGTVFARFPVGFWPVTLG
jgi:hypothetical protein